MKSVLIAPLDWGLGHASRCIPVIRTLLKKGCKVRIAGNGHSLALLRAEFPSLLFFELPGYEPKYPRNRSMVTSMISQLPKFIRTIEQEHRAMEDIISTRTVDAVISDNRYGCWSNRVPSVLITHQSNILMPKRFGWMQRFVRMFNERQMRKFTRCWIPDYPGEHSIAGKLIAFGKLPSRINVDYIGALSRFEPAPPCEPRYDIVAVCSGPEPQRSIFETLLLRQLKASGLLYVLIRGIPGNEVYYEGRGTIINFATTPQLQEIMALTPLVIARSGYSTIMDMMALQKKAVFIPTPGQTEQEYLAQKLMEKNYCYTMSQRTFSLEKAIEASVRYQGFPPLRQNHLLAEAISKILS
jgi:uncharacterized protein (TIGR00661 family)